MDISPRAALLALAVIVAVSAALRYALLTRVPAPFVFLDELGYQQLAHSIGTAGRLALFDKSGLSYSPLYSVLLAPIYALGASATAAYTWMRAVNVVVISLSVVPIYKISRFVLPRRESVGVAGLTMLAPLMYYSTFVMSENLAFPLCLTAIWAMLAALHEPRPRNDALLLLSILAATATRIQLGVLLPAALTALLIAAAMGTGAGSSRARRAVAELRRHWLLLAGTALMVAAGAARAATSGGLYSVVGRYGDVGKAAAPNPWRVVVISVEHLAGLDLAVGVVPFVAALVGAFAFVRFGRPARFVPFAAVAVSVIAWLVVETAYDAAQFDQADYRRIHERYLIYVLPLFLVALLRVVRIAPSRLSVRPYLAAAAVAALLTVLIPFGRLVNISNVADTFGLLGFGHFVGSDYRAVSHATLVAVWISATLGLTYVVVRHRMRSVVMLTLIVFLLLTSLVANRVHTVAVSARAYLPAHRDWVDRAHPSGNVVIVTGGGQALPWHLTAFNNESVDRVYSLCRKIFGRDFGDELMHIDASGRVVGPSGDPVAASYAVVPAALGVRGTVLASNPNGHQVLVAPRGGRVTVVAGTHARCD